MPKTHSKLGICLLALLCAAVAPKQPADKLDDQPYVTCKAWVIIDGKNGKQLFGNEENTPRKTASLTKIMCAYVVLQLAEKDPKVLEEVVTFSKGADDTGGSTADVSVDEKVTVAECLYGLLLPSGNDAGNALAEHFNNRFTPYTAGDGPTTFPSTNRSNFVAEMNRMAKRLGLKNTIYRIPYGDGGGDPARTSTAADLSLLTFHALQMPAFRKYVSTTEYEGTVTKPDGTTRPALWKNDNALLGIEGYDGVKTGITNQAGSCLVSSAHRGDDHLLCVVLGSTSNESRYTDTRNLLRWAWRQRGHKD